MCTATWTAYEKVWGQWLALEREVGGCASEGDHLCLVLEFIGRNVEGGVSASKLGQKMSGLAVWFQLSGVGDVTKHALVKRVLRGYRRGKNTRDSRRPVSFSMLGAIIGVMGEVCFSPYEAALFRTAFILAFFGAFRIGELVCRSKRGGGGLDWADVVLRGEVVSLFIRRSKTDQGGKGAWVTLGEVRGSPLCPVRAVREWLEVRGTDRGPLLQHSNGFALSRFQFGAVFKKCLLAAGFSTQNYSSHSFRIGAATEAARWGLEDKLVRQLGRWESQRFRLYVRPHLL